MVKFGGSFEGRLLLGVLVEIAALCVVKTVLMGDRDIKLCRLLYFPWWFSALFLLVWSDSETVPLFGLLRLSSCCSGSVLMSSLLFRNKIICEPRFCPLITLP